MRNTLLKKAWHYGLFLRVFLCLWTLNTASWAQYKTPLDELVLPQHKVRTLPHNTNKTWVMLSKNTLADNLRYYLQLCTPQRGETARWVLQAPSKGMAEAWLLGLSETPAQENANFMLNLHHSQSGINIILTLGEIKSTNAHPFRSIITLDTVPKRKGGK